MIRLGASGGGKWFASDCLPQECRVVENRFELYHKADQINFWDIFKFARDHNIKQIITIDNYIDGDTHYYPSETELRFNVQAIKKALIDNGISRDMAIFQLDNEPAKHKVPVSTYCRYANTIHSQLDGAYDLYVGGDEVTYRDWYNYVVPNSNNEGIAFHLQNCALGVTATDDSINFINALSEKHQKKVICSEGNYLDPSKEYSYNVIKYHISKCREIDADYCVIFLELNGDDYGWLSFKFNGNIRSPYYQDYIDLCSEQQEEDEGMKLEKYYYQGKVTFDADPDHYGVKFLQLCFGISVDGIMGDGFDGAVKNYQLKRTILVDGIVGPQTFNEIFKEVDNFKYYGLCQSYWARGITKFYEEDYQ